ncbi:MAG: hypothetical protein KDD84_10325 [Caldilineaceae bacterium]|nr:hypothetical protein [Caldilineaceae bacterium]
MVYRIAFVITLALGLFLLPAGTVSAQSHASMTMPDTSSLPPGIAKKVEPLLQQMMDKMNGMEGMSHPPAHMQHLQALINQLPPGILIQVLEAMLEFDMPAMMQFHQAIEEGLLSQPPGQILNFAQALAQ